MTASGEFTPMSFIKRLKDVAHGRHLWQLLDSWLLLAACTIAKAFNLHDEKIEKDFEKETDRYSKEQSQLFGELLGAYVLHGYSDQPPYEDFLGKAFMEAEISNSHRGQFFTPPGISQLMADLLFDKLEIPPKKILTIDEPASGSGAMVLAVVNRLHGLEFPYASHAAFYTTDIDVRCFQMTYLQLATVGAAACVKHGNTLSQEIYRTWYTPAWVLNRFSPRLKSQAVASSR